MMMSRLDLVQDREGKDQHFMDGLGYVGENGANVIEPIKEETKMAWNDDYCVMFLRFWKFSSVTTNHPSHSKNVIYYCEPSRSWVK